LELGRLLVDVGVDAGAQERQRGRQSADTATHDRDLAGKGHRVSSSVPGLTSAGRVRITCISPLPSRDSRSRSGLLTIHSRCGYSAAIRGAGDPVCEPSGRPGAARRAIVRTDQGQGMPDVIRANVGVCSRPRRIELRVATAFAAVACPTAAQAAQGFDASLLLAFLNAALALDPYEIAALALTLGVIFFATLTAIMLLRTPARAERMEAEARVEIMALKAEVDRAKALLLSEPQVIVVWPASGEEPEILGDSGIVTPAPVPRRALAFGTWLDSADAGALDSAVETLRARGQGFALALTTTGGRHIEAEGRAVGNRAVLRLKDTSGATRELADLRARHDQLLREIDTLQSLIEALPAPIWARDGGGRLVFVNPAYVRAV